MTRQYGMIIWTDNEYSSNFLHQLSRLAPTMDGWMCLVPSCGSCASRARSIDLSGWARHSGSLSPNLAFAASMSSSGVSAKSGSTTGGLLTLRAGDLVLFPRGDAHELCSVGAGRHPAQSGVALAHGDDSGSGGSLAGIGAETVLLCGAFFVTRHDHPALALCHESCMSRRANRPALAGALRDALDRPRFAMPAPPVRWSPRGCPMPSWPARCAIRWRYPTNRDCSVGWPTRMSHRYSPPAR